MPNMFSRRRGSSNPPVDRDTRAAAAAAAGSAFLHSAPSNASLASAAAGAALRSRTTTPEPVGSIQTKRMVRRGSVSSVGSGSIIGSSTRGGVGRGGLQRQNSGGSMTERTFRLSSPGPRTNGVMSPAPDAPPVPALPRNIPAGHKRASSLEPPQRMMSPTPRGSGRGVSVDRGGASAAPPATSRHSKRLSNVVESEEQNNNRNFSRPMSPSSGSVAPKAAAGGTGVKKYTHGSGSWFTQAGGSVDNIVNGRPKTSDGLPAQRAAAGFAGQDVINASNKPVSKNRSSSGVHQGSHLAQANNEPTSMSYDTEDTVMVYDPNTRTFTSKPRDKPEAVEPPLPKLPEPEALAPGTYDPHTRKIVPGRPQAASTAPGTTMMSADSDAPARRKSKPVLSPVETELEPPPRNPARLSPSASPSSPRAAGMLHHQPSVVREDPEEEEKATAAYSSTPLTSVMKSTGRTIQTSAGPAKAYVTPTHQRSSSLDIPRGGNSDGRGRGGRLSSSPARSAHFSASPVIEAIRHDPPPRSISPVKSAMKHGQSPASSVRTASPMAGRNFSPLPGAAKVAPSDTMSDAGESVASSQEGSGAGLLGPRKKKSVRVSFDEQPHELGPNGAVSTPKASSTVSPSSVARERSPAWEDPNFETEMMKPRPALPSFGSVRRNGPMSPEVPEKVTEMPPERGASSDHAVGGILVNHAAASKRDESAPLPPEVTSKETAGYGTDESEEESSSFRPDVSSTPAKPITGAPESAEKVEGGEPKTRDFATETAKLLAPEHPKSAADVPTFNLLPPTPGEEVGKQLEEEGPRMTPKPKASFEYTMPGGWGGGEESSEDKNIAVLPPSSQPAPITTPAVVTSAPEPKTLIPEPEALDRRPSPILDDLTEESDASETFSDAEEDLSHLDDGGFASLDAIVTSPISPSSPATADKCKAAEVPDSPSMRLAEKKAALHAAQGSGDWNDVTAHWSRLSRQQKEQIERTYLSSDDEARPAPAVVAKKQQPRKKKSALKQTEIIPAPAPQPQQERSMPKTLRNKAAPAPVAATATTGTAGGDGEVHMRRSMRGTNGSQPEMRSTMRSGAASPRPQSEVMSGRQNRNMPARPMSAAGPAPSQLAASGLPARPRTARADSDASEGRTVSQESSFPRMQGNRQPAARQTQAAPIAPSGAYTAKLQRQVTKDDSDSESSFKKKRRGSSVDPSGRYNMRRSMRAGSVGQASVDMRPTSPTPAAPGAKRGGGAFSIRSLSPSGGSVFGRGRGEKLRESLRSGSVDAGPGKRTTLRQIAPAPTMRGPGRPSAASAAPPAKSRFKSRFGGDSDDEDDGRSKPGLFRSRFADSDDDEPTSPGVIPADLRPVRGIPRRAGRDDGDSTDLEDEEDVDPRGQDPRKASRKREKQNRPIVPDPADVEKAMAAARRNLGISATDGAASESRQGDALSKGSLRAPAGETGGPQARPEESLMNGMPEKKRRGFMGSILRRNRNSTQSVQQVGSPPPASPVIASPQVSKPGESSIPSSPSTGKLVRRGSQQPQPRMTRGDSSWSNATAPPMASSLRNKDSDNWPLPPVPKINGDSADRPNTSDGVNPEAIKLARTMRPDIGQRSQSNQVAGAGHKVVFAEGSKNGDEDESKVAYSRRTGKKKKFGMLRRAFGLDD